jgi:hypothetical protein
MLVKLLKYEFMAEWKKYTVIYIVMAVLAMTFAVLDKSLDSLGNSDFVSTLSAVFLFTFIAVSMLAFVLVVIFSSRRFYNNMFRDEGYLMNTLPVSVWTHIAAKLIATCAWVLLTAVVFVLLLQFATGAAGEIIKIFDNSFIQSFAEEMDITLETSGIFWRYITVLIVLSPLMLQIYLNFCIAFGSLFNKHKLTMSVVMFMAVSVLGQIISSAALAVIGFSSPELIASSENNDVAIQALFEAMNKLMGFSFIISVILYGVMLYFTGYIMKKHLNLE